MGYGPDSLPFVVITFASGSWSYKLTKLQISSIKAIELHIFHWHTSFSPKWSVLGDNGSTCRSGCKVGHSVAFESKIWYMWVAQYQPQSFPALQFLFSVKNCFHIVQTNFPSLLLVKHKFYLLQIHILRWPAICDWTSPLWTYIGRNVKRHCHSMGPPEWLPCGKTVWLGLSRLTSGEWMASWYNTVLMLFRFNDSCLDSMTAVCLKYLVSHIK